MYDMYPEWGPQAHDPDNPHSAEAVRRALEQRDERAERPDDN